MIETRTQAEALHSAIEARDDAWNRFHNAALMPANQTPDERLVQTANNWVAAEQAVEELSHGVALVQTDGLPEPSAGNEGAGTSAGATVKSPAKKRGRPPKAKAPAAPAPAGDALRSEEEIRAAGARAAEASDADAAGDGGAA